MTNDTVFLFLEDVWSGQVVVIGYDVDGYFFPTRFNEGFYPQLAFKTPSPRSTRRGGMVLAVTHARLKDRPSIRVGCEISI